MLGRTLDLRSPHAWLAGWLPSLAYAGLPAAIVVLVAGLIAGPVVAGTAIGLGTAGIATWVDVRRNVIPDALVLATACAAAGAVIGDPQLGRSTITGVVLASVPVAVVHVLDPRWLGFGDVKLAAALGAVAGLTDGRAALTAVGLAAGAGVLGAVATRRPALAFAPFLVAATAVVVAVDALNDAGGLWP